MYFTEGELLEYEKMMKSAPPGKRVPALSSTNLPLFGSDKPVQNKTEMEGETDECGQ